MHNVYCREEDLDLMNNAVIQADNVFEDYHILRSYDSVKVNLWKKFEETVHSNTPSVSDEEETDSE